MKRIKLSVMFIVAALSIAAIGSAALSDISFERKVSAGQVLVDTDENVAIQISNISNYSELITTESDGKVSINLNAAINGGSANGFNTDATFTIGTQSSGVIRIKNNSDMPVTVSMTNEVGTEGAITLMPTTNYSNKIGVGSASEFYFVINTHGQNAYTLLNAVLNVTSN